MLHYWNFSKLVGVNLGFDEVRDDEIPKKFLWEIFFRWAYRIYSSEDVIEWTDIVSGYFWEAFPSDADIFGCDFFGRQFWFSKERKKVYLFEAGTGEFLSIECPGLWSFHNEIMMEDFQDILCLEAYQEGKSFFGEIRDFTKCYWHVTPLFLGWDDEFSNMELVDMKVYWELMSQLWNSTKHLPDWTTVGNISFD